MKLLFKRLIDIDHEAKRIVDNAYEEAQRKIDAAKIEVAEKLKNIRVSAIKDESKIKKKYLFHFEKLRKGYDHVLNERLERIREIIEQNWELALEKGMELIKQVK